MAMDEAANDKITPTALSRETGISVPYASQLLGHLRTASPTLAIKIFRKTGARVKPLLLSSDDEINALDRALSRADTLTKKVMGQ